MISGRLRWNDRARLRLAGVRAALAEAGLDLPDWCVVEQPFTFGGGRTGVSELLAAAQPPTAIVCGNDLLAVGAILEAQARGLQVPRVGIDNLEIAAHLSPALTTVYLPTSQLGAQAGEMLMATLRGKTVNLSLELPIELVVRSSSGPALAIEPLQRERMRTRASR